jgi:hypothetical protein
VYGAKGRLRKKFVISMKAVLDDLTTLAQELRQSFPLHPDDRFGGISRMPAHLHLLYYQVSSTRRESTYPLLRLITYPDCCGSHQATTLLLCEKVLRVTTRGRASSLIKKDQTTLVYVTRSIAEDSKYFGKSTGPGPAR